MNNLEVNDLIILYGFFIAFVCVGIVFLILGWNKRKKYDLSRREGTSEKQMSAGVPFYDRDAEDIDALRPLEGDRRAWSLSRTFIKTGIIFAGIGLLGIIMFTICK